MKFLITAELGRLCRWLRLLGYDTQLYKSTNISALIISAIRESRIILTRDRKVPAYRGARVVRVSSDFLKDQLAETTKELGLVADEKQMFTRCILCNEPLSGIKKEAVRKAVPEYVFKTQEDFVKCPVCNRIYWPGTHWGNALKYLEEIKLVH